MGRAYTDILTQLGREETAGTAASAQKTMAALMVAFSPELDVRRYRAAGNKITTTSVLNRSWVQGNFEGGLSYNELAFLLAGLIGGDQPSVVGTGGYGWTFTPATAGTDAPLTFTGRRGDSTAAQVASQLQLKSLQIQSSRQENQVSGSLVGQAINNAGALTTLTDEVQAITITGSPTGGTFTLTYSAQTTAAIDFDATAAEVQAALEALSNLAPGDVYVTGGPLPADRLHVRFAGTLAGTDVSQMTANSGSLTGGSSPTVTISTLQAGGASVPQIAESPVSGNEIAIYVDSASGSLGATILGCPFNFNITLPDRFNEKWCLNRNNTSFAETVAIATEPTISFQVEFNAQARALYDAIVTSSLPTRFIRFEAIGANIGAGADYTIRWDFAAKVRAAREVPDVDGVYAYQFEFDIVHSASWGKAMSAYIINTLSFI